MACDVEAFEVAIVADQSLCGIQFDQWRVVLPEPGGKVEILCLGAALGQPLQDILVIRDDVEVQGVGFQNPSDEDNGSLGLPILREAA